MLKLSDPNRFSDNPDEKWDSCYMCGPVKYRALVYYDSGSVTPTVGETLTGATSGHTATVEGYTITTAGATEAIGVLELDDPVGYNSEDLSIFSDNENLNGSTGGVNMMTVNGAGSVIRYGRMYPDSGLIEYEGRKYCREHFAFRFAHDWVDESRVDTSSENERGT
jgi:hypothetical protein